MSIVPGTVKPLTFQVIGALAWFLDVGLSAGLGGSEALGWLAKGAAVPNFEMMFIKLGDIKIELKIK